MKILTSVIFAVVCAVCAAGAVAQVTVAPFVSPAVQFQDNTGAPLVGGKVCTFAAGTSTPLATYSDLGVTPNSNPVILDSGGRATIYLQMSSYKIVIAASTADSSCNPAIKTQDNISWLNVATTLPSLTVNGATSIASSVAATNLANQNSPTQKICGNYWTGSASAQDCWNWLLQLGTGSNPTSTLVLSHSGSSGAQGVTLPVAAVTGKFSTGNTNNILWVGTNVGEYATLAACYAALPAPTVTNYATGDGSQFISAGGGTCYVPAYWSETLLADFTLTANKSIYFQGPAVITQGTHQVLMAHGAEGVAIVATPRDNRLRGSGVTFDYTGNGFAWDLGDAGGTIDDITLDGIQIHTVDGGLASQPLRITNSNWGHYSNLDLERPQSVSASGIAFVINGGRNNFFDDNRVNATAQFMGGTKFNRWQGGNFATTVVNDTTAIDVPNGNHNAFYYPDRDFGGTNYVSFFNFGASGTDNRVWAHCGQGGVTNAVTFANGSTNNVFYAEDNNCTVVDNSASTSRNTVLTQTGSFICKVGQSSAVVGTGSDVAIFTCTLKGNTVMPGRGVRIIVDYIHTAGTASTAYKLKFGSTSVAAQTYAVATANTSNEEWIIDVFNNTGVQNSQDVREAWKLCQTGVDTCTGNRTGNSIGKATAAVDLTADQTITFTFNVAATDQVQPLMFTMELIP